MKIGIIGYGKMGKDIFALFFDKLKYAQFVIIDLYGAEKNTSAVINKLDKSLKRKQLTEEQYEFKKSSFLFTDDTTELTGCDIVIEAIFEDMNIKKEMFRKVAQVVSQDCLLLSNTSSLKISSIFDEIPNKERCFGLHFFYPVKLTGFIELNILPETSDSSIQKAEEIVKSAGKTPVVFSGDYHIYLNQILACIVSHAILLWENYGVSVAELNQALKELFPLVAPFDILDSIGLGLMAGSPENFRLERNQELLAYGSQKMNAWLNEGCPKETLCFLDFMAQRETLSGKSCDNAPLEMTALVLNEIVNAVSGYDGNKAVLMEAIQDTIGIAEFPIHYLKLYSAETLFSVLDKLYRKTEFSSYLHQEKDIWENILQIRNEE